MSIALDIGRLRHRLTIQVNTPSYASTGTTDSWAAVSDAYSDGGVVWGRIDRLRGYEAVEARQVNSRTTHRVTIRYNSSLTPKHRLLFGSRAFYVTGVVDIDERNAVQVVDCWEEVV